MSCNRRAVRACCMATWRATLRRGRVPSADGRDRSASLHQHRSVAAAGRFGNFEQPFSRTSRAVNYRIARWIVAALVAIGSLVTVAGVARPGLLLAAELWVGGATVSITPDRPVALEGQFHTRIARKVEAPVTATALAIESRDGDKSLEQAVMISCDLVSIPEAVLAEVRRLVRERLPELDPAKIFISATHTHTAPVVNDGKYKIVEEGVMEVNDYVDFLTQRLSQTVVKAWHSRRPGKVGWGLGYAVVGWNRRAVYADGRAVMYGGTDLPDFRALEAGVDPGVEVMFFTDKQEKLLALVVNVACPSQEVENRSAIHADFWHPVRENLRRRYGQDLLVLAWTGASGDISPHWMYRKQAEQRMLRLRGSDTLEELARRISLAVEDAYEVARKESFSEPTFSHRVLMLQLPLRPVTEEELAQAKAQVEALANDPSQYRRMLWHQSVVERHERQKTQNAEKVEVHVLRLGDVAIATNPFELFVDFGIQIKARSKALQTFVVQLTGPGGYLATAKAVAGGGYSAVIESTLISPEGGQMLVDRTVEAINQLFP